jgi:hypothetical protein
MLKSIIVILAMGVAAPTVVAAVSGHDNEQESTASEPLRPQSYPEEPQIIIFSHNVIAIVSCNNSSNDNNVNNVCSARGNDGDDDDDDDDDDGDLGVRTRPAGVVDIVKIAALVVGRDIVNGRGLRLQRYPSILVDSLFETDDDDTMTMNME